MTYLQGVYVPAKKKYVCLFIPPSLSYLHTYSSSHFSFLHMNFAIEYIQPTLDLHWSEVSFTANFISRQAYISRFPYIIHSCIIFNGIVFTNKYASNMLSYQWNRYLPSCPILSHNLPYFFIKAIQDYGWKFTKKLSK